MWMALYLKLQTNHFGDPMRLIIRSSEGAGFIRKLPPHVRSVITYRKSTEDWGLPLDAYVIQTILKCIPDIDLEPAMEAYIEYLGNHQQEIRDAVAIPYEYPEYRGRLYPAQHSAVKFLEVAKKAILGFDMGTGKTVIASAAVRLLDRKRVLIICVDTVKWNWESYLQEWAKRKDTFIVEATWKGVIPDKIITGTTDKRTERLELLRQSRDPMIVIMNYQQAQIHQETLKNMRFDCVICDEAHRITNRKHLTKNKALTISRAIHEIAVRAPYVWLLTGTAIRNTHDDLFNLLRMCDPYRFGSYNNFLSLYFNTVTGFNGYPEPAGIKDLNYFNTMLGHYMLVRTIKDIYPDMPDKIYQDMYVRMLPDQLSVYRKMEREFSAVVQADIGNGLTAPKLKIATNTISQMMALRQIALTPALLGSSIVSSGKLQALEELFKDIQETDTKVLLFTWFKSFIPYVEQILNNLRITYAVISGDVPSQERKNVEADLNSGKTQVVIGTLRSMSEGMNLQAATTVIFCDYDWTPAVNNQAEARVYRGGIETSPTIVRLIHKDSIDEDILKVVAYKEQIVDETTGAVEVMRKILERNR